MRRTQRPISVLEALSQERLTAQLRLTWTQEVRQILDSGVRDGMTILEAGCGPGIETEQLLHVFPQSTILAMDIQPGMVTQAEQYLATQQVGQWRLLVGSITAIPLPDAHVDCVFVRLLFMHVADPYTALREIYRVLKPNGILVIIDNDDDLAIVTEPKLPGVALWMQRNAAQQAAQGGNRYVGRYLPRFLQQTGFHHIQVNAILAHSDIVGLAPFYAMMGLDSDHIASIQASGVGDNQASDDIYTLLTPLFRAADPIIIAQLFVVTGRKPE
jgi:ubiquinone/menaquinone biosynthesis C-methylase UbiE